MEIKINETNHDIINLAVGEIFALGTAIYQVVKNPCECLLHDSIHCKPSKCEFKEDHCQHSRKFCEKYCDLKEGICESFADIEIIPNCYADDREDNCSVIFKCVGYLKIEDTENEVCCDKKEELKECNKCHQSIPISQGWEDFEEIFYCDKCMDKYDIQGRF
ncbi:hypothetical protein AAEX28_04825 [Lentisphaerota bacterium WC36G]|nr:hypothetical protein LJT99_07205 [Lentisphaerae bacterium WC36]UDQ99412.1 hypothetical protein LJT99_07685 [Lentisphaerae bacterium WC36]